MTAAAQKAVLQEALDVAHQFRENSALRNGIPTRPPRNVIGEEATPPEPRPIVKLMREHSRRQRSEQVSTAEARAVLPVPKLPDWAKGALVTGAIGLSGLGGVLATQLALRPREPVVQSPVQPQPAEPSAPPGPASGDLLRWLSREGYDRPPTPGVAR